MWGIFLAQKVAHSPADIHFPRREGACSPSSPPPPVLTPHPTHTHPPLPILIPLPTKIVLEYHCNGNGTMYWYLIYDLLHIGRMSRNKIYEFLRVCALNGNRLGWDDFDCIKKTVDCDQLTLFYGSILVLHILQIVVTWSTIKRYKFQKSEKDITTMMSTCPFISGNCSRQSH